MRFKTIFCVRPYKLARHVEGAPPDAPNMEFIGWVWLQRAALTNNFNHGWVAFLDAKLEPKRCSKCGQTLPPKS